MNNQSDREAYDKLAAEMDRVKLSPEQINQLIKNGYAVVPIEPSAQMLEESYEDALAENAAGVWRSMIGAALKELILQQRKVR